MPHWILDDANTPTVDYMRGSLTDPVNHGRLHFMTDQVKDGQLVPMDPDFVAWADAILKWVRRTFRYDRDRDLYVGPAKARN
jgi:hypothetical protein